jgi:DNA-binding MarR family transcriptional regulator
VAVRRPPLGTLNVGNLLRDPWLLVNETLIERVHAAGYPDVRVAHSAVSMHIPDSGSRVTELAERAQLTKPTVVYLVDDLERLGYVERVPDPSDGRAKLVLTAKGRAATEAVRRIAAELEVEWAALIGPDRMQGLRELLLDLRSKLWPPEES